MYNPPPQSPEARQTHLPRCPRPPGGPPGVDAGWAGLLNTAANPIYIYNALITKQPGRRRPYGMWLAKINPVTRPPGPGPSSCQLLLLAAGCLAAGCWLLATGCALAGGCGCGCCWLLAAGCWVRRPGRGKPGKG
jgi:hypothetical protein